MGAALRLPVLPARLDALPLIPQTTREPTHWPRYLRVVVTARCPLACRYCHMEGDPARPESAGGLPTDEWIALLSIALELGIRKLKLLGGEPLLRLDLPDIVRALRERDATVDISVITSGAVPAERLDRLYAAGLSRCNVSIHGFGEHAFRARGGRPAHFTQRQRFLDAVLDHARPAKLNYVYTGPADEADLGALLEWAASRPVLISVLDDLGNPDLDAGALVGVVRRLRGAPARIRVEPDPFSLPTLRLEHGDGLAVEIKSERLGGHAPWLSCDGCAARSRCREGIHALRLNHTGILRPCMDRPDVGADLRRSLQTGGPRAARDTWETFVRATAR